MTEDLSKAKDSSGKLITELPTQEIERRLSIMRSQGDDDHVMSRYFKRVYEDVLREREAK